MPKHESLEIKESHLMNPLIELIPTDIIRHVVRSVKYITNGLQL